jgi:hypothetical protein
MVGVRLYELKYAQVMNKVKCILYEYGTSVLTVFYHGSREGDKTQCDGEHQEQTA